MKTLRTYIDRLQRRLRGDQMGEDEGFSLAELIVVVAIIAILAAVAVPMYLNQQENARENGALSELRAAKTALSSWLADEPDPADIPAVGNTLGKDVLDGFGVALEDADNGAIRNLVIRRGPTAGTLQEWTFTGDVPSSDKTCTATMTDQPSCS